MKIDKIKKIVLAYSGGLDTSAIIPWLKENYNAEVIAYVANIGQSQESLNNIEDKAINSGASSCYVIDLRKKFIEEYIYPMLHTGAIYEGNYLLGTAIARPIIAKFQIKLALKLHASAVCHGSTGKGNDQVRFENAYISLAPNLDIIAPWRQWKLQSRQDLLKYLKLKNIHTSVTLKKIYSRDENIWHTSTEGGDLENPWNVAQENCWITTKNLINTPDNPEFLTLVINKGHIISINHKIVNSLDCLNKLNKIGATHGIGRVDIVENRLIGIKSRGCYETPGGTIMKVAIQAIEQLVLDKECVKWKTQIGLEMSYIIYDGKWFTPLRHSLLDAIKCLVDLINGTVIIKLYKGNVIVVQKKSPNSLYSQELATFNEDKSYSHKDAEGFIKILSITSRMRATCNDNNDISNLKN
ncbi:argininosuccinate synthase [Buchnera aphidicola (Nipponaphis monzeni)]|uniref:Argininosuccinate synthase n=1 Tax=Buchnera aphidicola (Nipponaphis monzeni) TaxID=2495405 RepID=A0A455T9P3_9GAMM|nr:argininosuccinate synthase [Buchnera aphidicola]BBI01058.1 argininosuccinate synthase [Buchnera aphidicola (Nipponaphis monzeni)]